MSTFQTWSTDSASHQDIYDVFLSHQSGDKSLVESIAIRLVNEQGLRPFLDKWHLIPGEPWQEALEEALDRSKTCAVFLGPVGLGPWENEEMRAALEERVRNKSFRVIPVLLPGAEPKDEKTLPRFLRRLTWVDFRGGLNDPDTFQRLIAGIRGVAPGPGFAQTTSAITPARTAWRTLRRLREVLSSVFAGEGKSRVELWKIVLPAALALLLSAPFIGAAIPRYKLQIKSPAFRKESVYEAPAGTVLIKWGMTKEQWFRETDVSDINANLLISKSSGEVEASLQNQPGEARATLKPGRYEVRIDAVAYQRTETIALQVGDAPLETATLSGTVVEPNGRPIQGALVTLDDLPGMKPVETDSDGKFTVKDISKSYGEDVKIRVVKEGYQPNPYTEGNIVLGKAPPRITLTREKK
jgi:TIR domain/Carboxypeptidase regulatory-like domain